MNKIHLLPKAQIMDIPATLRIIANEIEKGDYGSVKQLALTLINTDKELEVFSCGDTNSDKAVVLFTKAIHFLVDDSI